MAKKDFFIKESDLDDYQRDLLYRTLDQSMVVSGCAGSGKSVIALHKAKQIQKEKGNDYQIIVFTKSLSGYMNSGRNALELKNDFYYHWHWKNRLGCPKSDYVIVDEIQDFTKEEIEEFKKATRKHFFFFGDTAQSIYDGLKDTQNIRDIAYQAGLSEFPLYFNYRLPKPIAKVTESHIGVGTRYNEGTYKSTENSIPRIIRYSNYDKQIEAIARIIKNNNLTDVGIFFPIGAQVKNASILLTKAGINNEVRYNEDGKGIDTLNFNSSNPKLMTYHSAKGLQFETVFLPDCTIENDGKGHSKQKSLYVAMTRTYKNLYIMHNGDLTSFINGNVPERFYKTTEFDEISDI
ncbi:MAG: 3'-5' exonuclease [Bacteroidota bacterium]